MITSKGNLPQILDFKENEIYRVLEKPFYFVNLTLDSYKFKHDFNSIKEQYLIRNISLAYLLGKDAHTTQAQKIYAEVVSQMQITEDKYFYFLTRLIGKMLFLGNPIDLILDNLEIHISQSTATPFYGLTKEHFYDCYENYLLQRPYSPNLKCVVFNPSKNVNNCYKSIVMQRELGKFNQNSIKNSYQNNTISQIAEQNQISQITVKRHLKKMGISTKGNKKENTINAIKNYRKEHKKATQKEVSKALNLSIITIKRHWGN